MDTPRTVGQYGCGCTTRTAVRTRPSAPAAADADPTRQGCRQPSMQPSAELMELSICQKTEHEITSLYAVKRLSKGWQPSSFGLGLVRASRGGSWAFVSCQGTAV